MKRLAPLVRPLTLAALLGAGWNTPPAWPQAVAAVKAEAPLRGRAWQLANQAYAHYQAGRFARAATAAASAVQLRPDLLRLRMLLIYSLQKQGKNEEALKAIASARAAGLDEATLQQAETNVRAAAAGGAAGGPAGPRLPRPTTRPFPSPRRPTPTTTPRTTRTARAGPSRPFAWTPARASGRCCG